MKNLVMHYLSVVGSGNRLKKLNKGFHDLLQFIDRIYFPEEHEYKKHLQQRKKNKSYEVEHTSKKVIL